MTLQDYHIIKRPIVTEKSTIQEEGHNQVAFEVDPRAGKHQIKRAVESIFKVQVVRVNTMRMRGKPVRRGMTFGHKKSWKKAIVTLKEGDRIDFYESV